MEKMNVLFLLYILIFPCVILGDESTNENHQIIFNYNNTYKYNVEYTVYVNKYTEYIMEFAGDLEGYDTPARVTVASNFANNTYPLFITARQQKGVFSWQLPMLVQTPNSIEQFTNISRTLCPHNNVFSEDVDTCDISRHSIPIVHLTSSSINPIEVIIYVEKVEDFYIKLNSTTNFTCTPSQPKYYFFPFKQESDGLIDVSTQSLKRRHMCKEDLNISEMSKLQKYYVEKSSMEKANAGWFSKPKSVIVMIESDDDICAVVSIQNFSCPVFDNERDILYDGFYLTMTTRGGITLTQDHFPDGFYIVFIVKSSDEDCLCQSSTNTSTSDSVSEYFGWTTEYKETIVTNDGRVKSFSFRIVSTISYQEYMVGALATLAFFVSFYLMFVVVVIVQRKTNARRQPEETTETGITAPTIPHDNVNVSVRRRKPINGSGESSSNNRQDSTSASDTESDVESANTDVTAKDYSRLVVANLARCRPRVISARSKMYLFNVLTVAVFYTLPVIQLVVTYQRLLNQSGNQDLCYFNFLCAHPLFVLSDFNHVYSNLGYVMLGALFILLVWRRQNAHKHKSEHKKELGIPQHFGLLYAMGVALVAEGALSAAYHVCPNSMNFQFDTSFMYVTSILCMVKIYQSRHPDINARAHSTFAVLAFVISIGVIGVLNANVYFWIAFTILHLVTCQIMTFQIYYMGRFKLDSGIVCRAARELVTRPLVAITPTYCGRCVLLIIANLANWAIAGYGVSQHKKDFASHLLMILMSNLFLYTLFYIVMKLLHRETIRWYSWVFIALTYSIWFGSSYFYLDLNTNWALTPAQSRQSNRVCSVLQLYDAHDVWHILSATAMFFSFNMYLTIDDNLSDVPRTEIMVF